jgi:hypothetical protein
LRVLHAPELVGGHAGLLAAKEREIGLRSHCVSFWDHPFGYRCDEVLWTNPRSVTANEIKRLQLLWRAIREFDVIHFNFGMPILPKRLDSSLQPGSRARGLWRSAYNAYASLVQFRDLPLLKRLGKALFVTYQGDDARQGSYLRSHFRVSPIGEVDSTYYTPESDERKRKEIAIFQRYADGIYALNPDLLHVLPARARFLPYSHIDPREWHPEPPSGSAARPLVIHAPTHRDIKGTRFVMDAVSRLKAEGVQFDFTLVEGMPVEEARRIYARADLLVDQLLVGWYGGLSVECMALGKPAICYLREEDLRYVEAGMREQLPIIRAEPATIYQVLKDFLTTRQHQLTEIGARGRTYVERWHDPLRLARFLQGQYVSALQRNGRLSADPPARPAPPPAFAAARAGQKRILIMSFSDLADDPRVNRQIRLLADRFQVTAAGFADPQVPGVEFIRIPRTPRSIGGKALAVIFLKLELFDSFYWSSSATIHAQQALENRSFDLILANDVNTLPLARRLNPRHGVILDAHEYSPREFEDHFLWRLLFQRYSEYLCRKHLSSAAGMITVCQGIADEYRANFGVDPKVLTNMPPYHDLIPGETDADRIHLVHHGVALPSRKIELMIEMMDFLDGRFHLDLMLMPGPSRYFSRLKSLTRKHPRVSIVPPIPMRELPRHLNRYDIGLFLLPPTNFNYRHALPNKLFEFVQARLAVAIGPSPEMARVVRQHDCGVVSDDFSPKSLAEKLNRLDRQKIDHYKQRSHAAAKELCYENTSAVLLDMIDKLLESD